MAAEHADLISRALTNGSVPRNAERSERFDLPTMRRAGLYFDARRVCTFAVLRKELWQAFFDARTVVMSASELWRRAGQSGSISAAAPALNGFVSRSGDHLTLLQRDRSAILWRELVQVVHRNEEVQLHDLHILLGKALQLDSNMSNGHVQKWSGVASWSQYVRDARAVLNVDQEEDTVYISLRVSLDAALAHAPPRGSAGIALVPFGPAPGSAAGAGAGSAGVAPTAAAVAGASAPVPAPAAAAPRPGAPVPAAAPSASPAAAPAAARLAPAPRAANPAAAQQAASHAAGSVASASRQAAEPVPQSAPRAGTAAAAGRGGDPVPHPVDRHASGHAAPASAPVPEDPSELESWLQLLPQEQLRHVVGVCRHHEGWQIVELYMHINSPCKLTLRDCSTGELRHLQLEVMSSADHLAHVLAALDEAWREHLEALGLDTSRLPQTGVLDLFSGTNRIGLPESLHRISGIRPELTLRRIMPFVGFTLRLGRTLLGVSCAHLNDSLLRDIADRGASVLLIGAPCTGKTTILRDLSRRLDELGRKVVIVDTSHELAGSGLTAHPSVGHVVRLPVPTRESQSATIMEAVANHSPQVVVVDEIGRHDEVSTARDVARRGISLFATVHSKSLADLVNSPELVRLVGGRQSIAVTDHLAAQLAASDAAAATDDPRGTLDSKLQLMRPEPPVFDVVLELHSNGHAELHTHVSSVVDRMLQHAGKGTRRG